MQYTETELQALIQTVEKEFTAHLVKAEQSLSDTAPLVKAEDAPPKKDKSPADEKPAAEPKEGSDKPADDKKDAAPAPKEGEAQPSPVEGEAKPQANDSIVPAPAMEGSSHGYDEEDMEHMYKMYKSMSPDELKIHHDIIMKIAQEQQAAPAAPAAPAQAAPAAPVEKCGDMTMGKTEDAAKGHKNGGEISAGSEPHGSPGKQSPASKDQGNLTDMEKSEKTQEVALLKSELDAEKAKFADLKKNFDAVQDFITKLTKVVPQGKAITSMEQIAKSESTPENKELSKSEITAILNSKVADSSLSKSDREAINAYYLNNANVNTISHLLK